MRRAKIELAGDGLVESPLAFAHGDHPNFGQTDLAEVASRFDGSIGLFPRGRPVPRVLGLGGRRRKRRKREVDSGVERDRALAGALSRENPSLETEDRRRVDPSDRRAANLDEFPRDVVVRVVGQGFAEQERRHQWRNLPDVADPTARRRQIGGQLREERIPDDLVELVLTEPSALGQVEDLDGLPRRHAVQNVQILEQSGILVARDRKRRRESALIVATDDFERPPLRVQFRHALGVDRLEARLAPLGRPLRHFPHELELLATPHLVLREPVGMSRVEHVAVSFDEPIAVAQGQGRPPGWLAGRRRLGGRGRLGGSRRGLRPGLAHRAGDGQKENQAASPPRSVSELTHRAPSIGTWLRGLRRRPDRGRRIRPHDAPSLEHSFRGRSTGAPATAFFCASRRRGRTVAIARTLPRPSPGILNV